MDKKLQRSYPTKILFLLVFLLGIAAPRAFSQSPQPGDIIITEFMANPNGSIKYIELYNKRSVPFNIDGYTLRDDDTDNLTIDNGGTLTVPAEDFIILAAQSTTNFTTEYIYDSSIFKLNKTGDEIVLENSNGTQIARVNYTSSEADQGKAVELTDIGKVNSEGQAASSDYVNSNSDIGSTGDKGSPQDPGQTTLTENPTVRILKSSFTASEGSGSKILTVILEDPDSTSVSVDVVFDAENSEVEPADLNETSPVTLSFSSSASDGDSLFAYTPVDDTEYEGKENASFSLSNLSTSGSASIAYASSATLSLNDNDAPNVVVNEINAIPGDDANGDGTVDTDSDEFVEIVNNESVNVNIGQWELHDAAGIKHTFADTVLKARQAVVVFDSSGTPSGVFGGSIVVTSDSDLSLDDSGDTITLKDDSGFNINSHTYNDAPTGESIVRDPDRTGSFTNHKSADTEDNSASSQGSKIKGANFSNSVTIHGDAGWRMLSVPVKDMPLDSLEDDTHLQSHDGDSTGNNENLYTHYNGTAFQAPKNLDNYAFKSGKGFILYFFNNENYESQRLPVILDPGTSSEPTSDVTVDLHSSGDRWNLVGNPFNTALDVNNLLSWANNGTIQAPGQIWDDKVQSYILTSANSYKVSQWQGFFIENDDATSLTIPISAKTTSTDFYKNNYDRGYMTLTLKGKDADSDNTTTDKASVLYFHSEATDQWDPYDATKLMPLTSDYALVGIKGNREGEAVIKAQDSRSYDFKGEIQYDLELQAKGISGEFNISWEKKNLPRAWSFTLVDHKTGRKIDMNMDDSYQFSYQSSRKASLQSSSESPMSKSLPKITSVQPKKNGTDSRFSIIVKSSNSIGSSTDLPESAKLNPNYPNPFNPTTTLSYELAKESEVTLTIWNMIGQKVTTLVDGLVEAGKHTETWNASNMPSGIYIARFEVDGKVFTRKMTLIK